MAAIPASLLRLFAPLDTLLSDPSVRRVFVDGPDRVFAERHGRVERVDLRFPSEALEAALEGLARRAGKVFDAARPSLEARLKDGTRFIALRPPAVIEGPVLAVVRPGGRTVDLPTMVRQGTLNAEAAALLAAVVNAGLNVAVVGPPGSGRTSLTEALAVAMPPEARIGVLEDFPELRLPGRRPVRLIPCRPDAGGRGGVSVGDLLYCAGRLGLDRLLLGSVRWQDAWDAASVLARRAVPVIVTLPGLTAADALARFEAVARAGAAGPRERAVPGLLGAGLDLVVTLGGRPGVRQVVSIDRVRPDRAGAAILPLLAVRGDPAGGLRAVDEAELSALRETCRIAGVGGLAEPASVTPIPELDESDGSEIVEAVTEADASLPPSELVATQDGMAALSLPRPTPLSTPPTERVVPRPAARSVIAPPPPAPTGGDEDDEATMITDIVEPVAERGEILSNKTFSQILRSIGAESSDSVDGGTDSWRPPAERPEPRRTHEVEVSRDDLTTEAEDVSAAENLDLEPVLRQILGRRRGDRNTAVHNDDD